MELIHLLNSSPVSWSSPCKEILCSIKLWLGKDWEVQVNHIYREANLVADRLAKLRNRGVLGTSFWSTPPIEILGHLAVDLEV
ncbi:Reverse transcriptase-like [Sesbania bispinosa]|nr:Reverse transcriptase-like [Sesbania bispinosa]